MTPISGGCLLTASGTRGCTVGAVVSSRVLQTEEKASASSKIVAIGQRWGLVGKDMRRVAVR